MGGKISKDSQEVSEDILNERNDTKEKDNTDLIDSDTHTDIDNNLELYLNDLYEFELEFKISKEEADDIKNGIEYLVHLIVHDTMRTHSFQFFKSTWENTRVNFKDESDIFYDAQENLDCFDERECSECQERRNQQSDKQNDYNFIEDEDIYYDAVGVIQNNVNECKVQTTKPTNKKSESLELEKGENKRCTSNEQFSNTSEHSISSSKLVKNDFEKNCILGVGSIYENSKNHFPNEFDFIVVVGRSKTLRGLSFLRLFHNCLQAVLGRINSGKYYIKTGKNSQISFDRYVTVNGPASTLQFIYLFGNSAPVKIHVDITPAVRMEDVQNHIKENSLVFKGWYEEIVRRNCCLAVYVQDPEQGLHKGFARLTVTEFEMFMMRNVISPKHLKIYRLLKYLINSKDYNESLKVVCKNITNRSCHDKHSKMACSISSYVIKTFLFRHHYTCSKKDDKLADCLLDMLDEMESQVTSWPSGMLSSEKYTIRVKTVLNQDLEILKTNTFENNMKLGKAFRYMQEQLQKMYRSYAIYKYDNCNVTSWAELAHAILIQQWYDAI